jgi:hypothetical protein
VDGNTKRYHVNKNLYNPLPTYILSGMSKREAPLSLRISPEINQRLEDAAKKLGISKHGLAALCVEAGVIAVEKNDGLVLPLEFEVTRIPVPQHGRKTRYPSHQPSSMQMNEPPEKPKDKKSKAA